MRGMGQPIQKTKQGCGRQPCGQFPREPDRCGVLAQADRTECEAYSNFMSRHLEMSEPRPEEMVMQPRIFCAVMSAAQTE